MQQHLSSKGIRDTDRSADIYCIPEFHRNVKIDPHLDVMDKLGLFPGPVRKA